MASQKERVFPPAPNAPVPIEKAPIEVKRFRVCSRFLRAINAASLSVSAFSSRLSRACLGKKIVFCIKRRFSHRERAKFSCRISCDSRERAVS